MCGIKSKTGLKGIVVFCLLCLLAVSPCCAAASWGAWFTPDDTKATGSQQEVSVEESSQTLSTTPSETSEMVSTQSLMQKVNELDNSLREAETSLAKLDGTLESLKETEKISEADYQAVKASLQEALPENAKQADRIAELEKEAGSKAFALVGTFIGFENSKPIYGVTFDIGVRIGSSLLMQAGVEYELASFDNMLDFEPFSLDNMRFTAKIGWMW